MVPAIIFDMNQLEKKIAESLKNLVVLLAAESSDSCGRFEAIIEGVVDELIEQSEMKKVNRSSSVNQL